MIHSEPAECIRQGLLRYSRTDFGFLLITIGGDDELEGGGANAVPVYGAAAIGGQSGVQSGSQFTMPADDQFGIGGDG